jgi:YidC/Oxa1 family membrane protein insertase
VGSLWNSLVDGMGAILAFLYSVLPNYGFAIIGLTVLVRLALFPLTAKQARSMQKMQLIQPELKKLQAQYKNDRQKLNEEIMKFYKENQVNPMAGCLPLVLQMPIFFALYQVLISPQKRLPTDSKLYQAFCGDLPVSQCKDPKGLSFLGMDLGEAAAKVSGGFVDALPYFLLIALVVVTGYLQFKQTQSRQTTQANPQMAIMGKIFPVMFAFISYSLPSGVVLYFLVSNAWQIGQQALIFRTMPAPPAPPAPGTVAATGSAPRATNKPDSGKPPAQASEPPAQEGRFKRALREGRDRGAGEAASGNGDGPKPTPKRPPAAGGGGKASGGDGTLGRAQPSGSQPRPKKRRR